MSNLGKLLTSSIILLSIAALTACESANDNRDTSLSTMDNVAVGVALPAIPNGEKSSNDNPTVVIQNEAQPSVA